MIFFPESRWVQVSTPKIEQFSASDHFWDKNIMQGSCLWHIKIVHFCSSYVFAWSHVKIFCPHVQVFYIGQKFQEHKKWCQIGPISNTFPLTIQREVSHWKASKNSCCEKQPWGYIFFEGSWAEIHIGPPLFGSQVEGKKLFWYYIQWIMSRD